MQFSFHCLVLKHTSGRVTVTPVEHPEMAVHAETLDSAVLDLMLAFDDRICRAHPRLLARYAGGADGEAVRLSAAALRVWHGETHSTLPLKLMAWKRPTLNKLSEVYVPKLDLRFWLEAAEAEAPAASVVPVMLDILGNMDDSARLAFALEGRASFEVIQVESAPLRLSSLKPAELTMDARPFRSAEEQAEIDAEDDVRKRRQRARAEERKRREQRRRQTPTLKALGLPLHTRAARARLDPAWERDAELDRLLAYVERERPQPLVLIAPQGSGKTSILEALARRMGDPKGPRARRARPVFQLDASRLIAGTGAFGAWQEQLQTCIEEARRSGALLLLGQIDELLDAGRSAQSDNNVAQALAPVLASREVCVLAEATPESWALVQRRNASFASVWASWSVAELSPDAVRRVLDRVAEGLAERHAIKILPGVVEGALALCRRFWPYGSLVGNAVTFLRRLVAARAHDRAPEASARDAIEFFSGEAGIPVQLLRDDLPLDPAEVRAFLAARVMAQPHAVERAVQVVSTIKASLQDPKKPAAVLLFAGPTGVGKTELAKALAEFVFGSRDRLIRVDMGEYLGPDALDRLLGGGDGAGLLPSVVRRQPFCVLLLDELEKAHPVVFDALLGVLGEGRLTDASGRVTDFRNAVVVMTTNLGADTLRARVGFGGGDEGGDAEAVRRHYLAEAQRFFRPEFFNRLDELVVFRPLGADAIASIVRREVEALSQREGILRRDIDLRTSDAAHDLLAREGLDPRLGARPLKRTIERRLAIPVASWLASHRQAGPSRVHADVAARADALRFRAEPTSRGTEGSRAHSEQLLDDAADLRALFCKWDRSAAVQSLRSRLNVLDHSLRSKGFWEDTSLAEELSREASMLRDLVEPLAEIRRGAEAAEDLAVEAWYDRRSDMVETIRAELDLMAQRFASLPRRIYLARGPQTTAGILYLSAPRNTWSQLVSLFQLYKSWATGLGLQAQGHVTMYIDPEQRPGTKPDDPEHAWEWKPRDPWTSESVIPAAVALEVRGSREVNFLQLEEGAHRFADGSDSVLKARFFPLDARVTPTLRSVKSLAEIMKVGEIRRYSASKGRMHDFRLDEDFPLNTALGLAQFDLDAYHARCIERGCLNDGDLSWS